jgi:hypothetical protein
MRSQKKEVHTRQSKGIVPEPPHPHKERDLLLIFVSSFDRVSDSGQQFSFDRTVSEERLPLLALRKRLQSVWIPLIASKYISASVNNSKSPNKSLTYESTFQKWLPSNWVCVCVCVCVCVRQMCESKWEEWTGYEVFDTMRSGDIQRPKELRCLLDQVFEPGV